MSRRSLGASFRDAMRGLIAWVRHDAHGRIVAVSALAVIIAGALVRLDPREWALALGAVGLVGAAEALNSALETLADALHPGEHAGIGRAKDVAAGAVLLAILVAAAIGALVFLPRLLGWWRAGG
ncbi:MAG: diacylglycerol kinase family protein [Kiritimatiellae bacterium]|nr:diacylglycerol kinase family protein [Kiritimatiellia bacterium]